MVICSYNTVYEQENQVSQKIRVYMDMPLLAFYGETVFPLGEADHCVVGIAPESLYKAVKCYGKANV